MEIVLAMTRIARFLGVLWSLLWRATLLALPLMLLFVAGMAVLLAALLLPPIWAYGPSRLLLPPWFGVSTTGSSIGIEMHLPLVQASPADAMM